MNLTFLKFFNFLESFLVFERVKKWFLIIVFVKINAHPEISAHQKQWFFKGGSTQNRWLFMGDFSKGGVHETDGFLWVDFSQGDYIKPMGFDGWFFKGGSTQNRWVLVGDSSKGGVHKTDGLWWGLECFLLLLKIKRSGRLFRQIRCAGFPLRHLLGMEKFRSRIKFEEIWRLWRFKSAQKQFYMTIF